ncbi:MAG: hypothetical protein ACPGU1_13445 [Myxococcota bacterium]
MQPDLDTRAALILSALCVVALAFENLSAHLAPPARAEHLRTPAGIMAGDTVSCRVPGNGYKRCLPVFMGQ